MRKIIRLSTFEAGWTALCDDGTAWRTEHRVEGMVWEPLPPIPQPDAPAPVARPISDKVVRAALHAHYNKPPSFEWSPPELEKMRATLEAAEAAREA